MTDKLKQTLCDVAQLLDGWHADETWTEWDTDVRNRISALQQDVESGRLTYTDATAAAMREMAAQAVCKWCRSGATRTFSLYDIGGVYGEQWHHGNERCEADAILRLPCDGEAALDAG